MLKTLLKKQFREVFSSYFVDKKTGKARSKGKTVVLFLLFGLLMVFLLAVFFAMAMGFGEILLNIPGTEWLFYALMGIIAVAFGTFGSVFNTYASLYMAKDNETLLSMPIPPRRILITRMSTVYGLSFLYCNGVWLPALIAGWISSSSTALAVVLQLLLLFIIPLFVTVLCCALGWVVALIASKAKGKSYITVILALAFFIPYYYLCFNSADMFDSLANSAEGLSGGIKTWGNLFYQLGKGSMGQLGPFLIFAAISAVLFAACFWVLSKTFLKIALAKPQVAEKKVETKALKAASVKKALYRRELKRFTYSATYMLNTGLGVLFALAIPIIVFIKRADIRNIYTIIPAEATVILNAIPLAITGAFCLLAGLNQIATPSVSLEGKTLWIIRSLPVSGKEVLQAKLKLHTVINAVPMMPALMATELIFGYDIAVAMEAGLILLLFIFLIGELGLMLGILKPNFNWTTETQPIKSSTNILIMMLVSLVLIALIGLGYYLTRNVTEGTGYLYYAVLGLLILDTISRKLLFSMGAEKFEQL